MKVYLAGKITGDQNYREKFAAAAKGLLFLFLYVMLDLCWIARNASLRASCMKAGLTVLCWRGSACFS